VFSALDFRGWVASSGAKVLQAGATRLYTPFTSSAGLRELSPPPTSGIFQPALYALSYNRLLRVHAVAPKRRIAR